MAALNIRLLLLLRLIWQSPAALAQSGQPGQPGQQGVAVAAPAELVPGPRTVPLTGYYTLGFRLRDAALQQHSPFPELEGFRKNGKTSTLTTRVVQGRRFSELTISQRYVPYGEGDLVVKPFQLLVNGQLLRSAGGRVRVLPAAGAAAAPPAGSPGFPPNLSPSSAPNSPPPAGGSPAATARPPAGVGLLDQLLGKPKPAFYTEPADHAFLALAAERPQVYQGEGVRVGLYFYLTPPDQALLAFHDYNDQLPRLLQQLRQPGAWVVPAPEAPATPDSVRRGGQLYLRYRLAESTYYPLTTAPLRFPPLALTMTKFRLLKKPEPGVDNRLATYKTFVAPGLRVAVRPRPPAPAGSEPVLVGEYALREALSTRRPLVGQPFTYSLGVEGRGNLAALTAPDLQLPAGYLEAYGPSIREQALPDGRTRKTFRYRLIARQPGIIRLDTLLAINTFNPRTARYRRLRPTQQLSAGGAAVPASAPGQPADDAFYGPALAEADTNLQNLDAYGWVRQAAGLLVLALLGGAAVGWWKARTSPPRT